MYVILCFIVWIVTRYIYWFKFRTYKRLPPTPLTKSPSQRQSMLLASPISFQEHFYTKGSIKKKKKNSHKVYIYWEALSAQNLQQTPLPMVKLKLFSLASKGLFEISVSLPPFYIPNAPTELQCYEMALLDALQTLLHLWAFALLGRKLWDTSFGQSAPQSLGPSSKGSI